MTQAHFESLLVLWTFWNLVDLLPRLNGQGTYNVHCMAIFFHISPGISYQKVSQAAGLGLELFPSGFLYPLLVTLSYFLLVRTES